MRSPCSFGINSATIGSLVFSLTELLSGPERKAKTSALLAAGSLVVGDVTLVILSRPGSFGGVMPMIQAPCCGRAVRVLYDFKCRKCGNVVTHKPRGRLARISWLMNKAHGSRATSYLTEALRLMQLENRKVRAQ